MKLERSKQAMFLKISRKFLNKTEIMTYYFEVYLQCDLLYNLSTWHLYSYNS